jgi:hypothetical protein
MPLYNSLQDFMGGLKGLPKAGPERGIYVTKHMNHGPFLSALQAHPQGPQLHKQLNGYLNSTANAGPAGGSVKVGSMKMLKKTAGWSAKDVREAGSQAKAWLKNEAVTAGQQLRGTYPMIGATAVASALGTKHALKKHDKKKAKARLQKHSAYLEKLSMAVNTKAITDWAGKHKDSLTHGAELAGLGILAAPSVGELRNKGGGSEEDEQRRKKRHAKYEIGGLGLLAAPSAISLAKHVMHKTSSADIRAYAAEMFGHNRLEELAEAMLKEAGIIRPGRAGIPGGIPVAGTPTIRPASPTLAGARQPAPAAMAGGHIPERGGFRDPHQDAEHQRQLLRADLRSDLTHGRLTGMDRVKAVRSVG